MAKILSVFSQKGGVGKTILSVNISAGLALMLSAENSSSPGRVLLVDLDEQAHSAIALSGGFDGNQESVEGTPDENIAGLLLHNTRLPTTAVLRESKIPTYAKGNLDYVPSSREKMAPVSAKLRDAREMGLVRLSQALEPIKHLYDYIVIDNPPGLSYLALNGLIAASHVLLVTQLETPSLESMNHGIQTIVTVQRKFNHDLKFVGIVPNMCDFRRTEQRNLLEALKQRFPGMVLPAIHRRAEITYAISNGLDIFSFKPARNKEELESSSMAVHEFIRLLKKLRGAMDGERSA